MDDYLERLERLTNLFERGALSKDEFEQEKLRLREGSAVLHEHPENSGQHRKWLVPVAAGGTALLGLIGGAYVLTGVAGQEDTEKDRPAGAAASNGASLDVAVSFSDSEACRPSVGFQALLDELARAAFVENVAADGVVRVAGLGSELTPRGEVITRAGAEARVASLPVDAQWQGLRVTEIRTTRWNDGMASAFQLRFAETAPQVAPVLKQVGLPVPKLGTLERHGKSFVAWESSPQGGSTFTCISAEATAEEAPADQV